MDPILEKKIRNLKPGEDMADVVKAANDPIISAATMMLLTKLMRQTGVKEIEIDMAVDDPTVKDAVAIMLDRPNKCFKAVYVTEEEANAVRQTH